jgi:hypothetical protein
MVTATAETADFEEPQETVVERAVRTITSPVTDRTSRAALLLAAGTGLAALAPSPLDVGAVFVLAYVCVEWKR